MIGKIVLGESLNGLIGELKLSYRRVSTIIGESLAAMRSALRRSHWVVIFIAKSSIKLLFFAFFTITFLHQRSFLKDQP
ncbi:chromosome partitioning protein ParB [Alloprevotella tannerae]|uniref:chromosome partitioning protein ParB n=1 Tax=Alloprevotella tannerae TaxID=76122 RepID=UPI0028EF01F1|nr:chromosome partitioning protein ParB [Alloprevotella tannerae]